MALELYDKHSLSNGFLIVDLFHFIFFLNIELFFKCRCCCCCCCCCWNSNESCSHCSKTALEARVELHWTAPKSSQNPIALKNTPKPLPNCSQTAPILLPYCSETISKLLPNCSEITPKMLPKLLPNCSETALKLLWNCSETALKLLWISEGQPSTIHFPLTPSRRFEPSQSEPNDTCRSRNPSNPIRANESTAGSERNAHQLLRNCSETAPKLLRVPPTAPDQSNPPTNNAARFKLNPIQIQNIKQMRAGKGGGSGYVRLWGGERPGDIKR